MSTVIGQIVDPTNNMNSTWNINIQNENKINESDNTTIVPELNVDKSKESNIQHPLKYTVLQNADSTVMDHYNSNQNVYELNTYTEPTSTTSQLDQHLVISTNNLNKNQADEYFENNQKINYSKTNLNNYDGFNYIENQFNEETFQNQSFTNNNYSINQSSQNQNSSIVLNENNQVNKNVYEEIKQPTKNSVSNYCNLQQDRPINNRHFKNTDRSSKFLRPHSTPATLIWLEENYETADGVCIPRSTLYMHYVDFCSKNYIQPVNAASFGKIIRQQFPQLTTRRLGTRGQSRYHYYGIAVKESSIYHQQAYSKKNSTLNSSLTSISKESEMNKGKNFFLKSNENSQIPGLQEVSNFNLQQSNNSQNNQVYYFDSSQHQNLQTNFSKNSIEYNDQSSSYLNNSSLNGHHGITINLPEFPNVKKLRLRCKSAHFSNKHLLSLYSTFLMMYRTHCQRILDTLVRCNLTELNTFTNYFWQAVPEHLKCVLSEPVFHCLIAICDCILYKCMAQILSAPLFQSNLPDNLVKIINKFSDQLEWNTKSAMNKLPEALKLVKLALSRKSACLLRKQSLLSKHINETKTAISSDFNVRKLLVLEFKKVDVSIVLNDGFNKLDDNQTQMITTAINEFEILLKNSNVNDWLNWINSLLNKCISFPNQKLTFIHCAKKFYKIWDLLSTNILKQLNQMISPFYRIFYSIHCLFNDYILYSLEFLHFDERIKEFTLGLYQDYCPNIIEPFFQEFETNDFNLKQNLYLKNNFNYDQTIKAEKNDNSFENYNSKNIVCLDQNYDTQLYSACSTSYYNSDYYQQQSANNYHNCPVNQLQVQNNLATNNNYPQENDSINHFHHHQLNNYCNNSNLNPNHHHLHHHLHHQTYHLFINNSSNNPNFSSQNYNSNEQQNENYQLNYMNLQKQQNSEINTDFLPTESNFNNVTYEQLSPIENQLNPDLKTQTSLFYQSNTYQ